MIGACGQAHLCRIPSARVNSAEKSGSEDNAYLRDINYALANIFLVCCVKRRALLVRMMTFIQRPGFNKVG